MLTLLSTFAILTAAAFAAIVLGSTLAGSWNLIVAALNVSHVVPVDAAAVRGSATDHRFASYPDAAFERCRLIFT